ncbi:hypothetical protein [Spirosoma montaniterrae]|uniref:Lipopolysaccharide biosynthesis protein n=1 Tax=Spirosoma montaniterrae TaxID=1178516 RepID=A0A1P9WW99_9BACT|nr:hypothetical protein [Spirosoma montaniterrae]AQG79654.1 hypothetical protein AWR27_10130 [Spirosoma montaniterrae]
MTPPDQNNIANTPYVVKPLPPDQISPKSVVLTVLKLKNVVRRNWKVLVVLLLIGGIGGFIYDLTHEKKPLYNASITFNLGGGSGGSNFGELGALAGAFGLSSGAPDANIFVGDNFQIYAKSRPVVEKTLMRTVKINGQDTLLIDYYIQHSGIRDEEWEESDSLRAFAFRKGKKTEEFNRQEQLAMSDIYTRIKSEMSVQQPERKSSFMEIRASMQDEQLTAVFLSTHLETIEEDYRKKQTKKTREMLDLLDNRADSLARVLTGTESRLAQYIDQNQQVVAAQGRINETKLTRNSTFLSTLYYQALQSADNMRLSLIREAPLFTIIEPVTFPLYREIVTTNGKQIGIALALLLSFLIIFFRETYRSVMREE